MMELSKQNRELLSALRNAQSPTPEDQRRVRTAVLARVGAAGVGVASLLGANAAANGAAPMSAAATKTGSALWIAKLASVKSLALLGTGAVVTTGSVLTWQATTQDDAAQASASHSVAAAALEAPEATRQATALVESPEQNAAPPPETQLNAAGPPSEEPAELVADQKAEQKTARQKRVQAKPVAPPTKPTNFLASEEPSSTREDTLGAEVKLVRSAHQALQSGNTSLALDYVAEHARRFPRGMLASERQSVRAIIWCQTGKLAKGRSIASRLLGSNSSSPLAARLRAACQLTEKPNQ